MNCSVVYLKDNVRYTILQNIALITMVVYFLAANITAILLTLVGTSLGKCPVNKMMLSSQFGNIIGGLSFFMNEVYYSQNGTVGIGCKSGLDIYFFKHLGVNGTLITLLFHSISTYNGIVRNCWMLSSGRVSTAKTFTLIWIIAVLLTALLVLVNWFHNKLQFVKSTSICAIVIITALLFYVRVLRFLSQSKDSTETSRRAESKRNAEKAIFVIKISVGSYAVAIAIAVVCNVVANFLSLNEAVTVVVVWVIRAVYVFLFTIEPHLFMWKNPNAKKGLLHALTCGKWKVYLLDQNGRLIATNVHSSETTAEETL